jgi:hypothetical protein
MSSVSSSPDFITNRLDPLERHLNAFPTFSQYADQPYLKSNGPSSLLA